MIPQEVLSKCHQVDVQTCQKSVQQEGRWESSLTPRQVVISSVCAVN